MPRFNFQNKTQASIVSKASYNKIEDIVFDKVQSHRMIRVTGHKLRFECLIIDILYMQLRSNFLFCLMEQK